MTRLKHIDENLHSGYVEFWLRAVEHVELTASLGADNVFDLKRRLPINSE